MSFTSPELLWYLLGIPVVGLLLLASSLRNRRVLVAFTTRRNQARLVPVLTVKTFLTAILFSGALAGVILALAGPQWGEVSEEDERRGIEIVFLFDVSNSMAAEDVQPSRIERSREAARSIASRVENAFVSAVVFKGEAVVVVPMTEDSVAFELAISRVSSSAITVPGTDIGAGLTRAVDALPPGSARHRTIVLFSDGGELTGDVDGALQIVRGAQVPVIVVAAGTEAGGVIPTVDGAVIRDSSGNPVITRLQIEILQEIAEQSGGSLHQISDRALVATIVGEINEVSGVGRQVMFRRTSVDRYHLFVSLTLLLLTLGVLVQNLRWRDTI